VVREDGVTVHLTARERALLHHLAARPERVVSREELLVEVFGMDVAAVSRAVDVAIRRLREKIEGVPEQPDHLVTVFGQGYRFVPTTTTGALPPDPSFVGRTELLAGLRERLQRPGTLLLTGPAGVGKTRLSRRVVAGEAELAWVDVTEARTRADVAQLVARAVGVDEPERPEDRLVGHLTLAEHPVLVLDNCEGAAEAVGALVTTLRARVPALRVLLTSRVLLPADHVEALHPLTQAEAVALFLLLAERARPGGVRHELDAVEVLVETLERVPLALALAAGRAGAMSVRAMVERSSDRFRLLQTRDRDGDPRQRSLEAALAWSWDLSTPRERDVLFACASFRSGFTAEAVRAVAGGDDAAGVLATLCAGSWLEDRGGRYGGYAFVREFVAARLAAEPAEEDRVFRAHGAWFQAVSSRSRTGRDRARALADERDNLVVATQRACDRGDWPTAMDLGWAAIDVLGRRGPWPTALALLEALAAWTGAPPSVRVRLDLQRARFRNGLDVAGVLRFAESALAGARAMGDPVFTALALRARGMALREQGALQEAWRDLAEAEDLVRGVDVQALLEVMETSGSLLRLLGRLDEAGQRWQELERLTRSGGDVVSRVNALGNLALLERRSGALDRAEARLREVIHLAEDAGVLRQATIAHTSLGSLLLDRGDLDGARAAYLRGGGLARELGELPLLAMAESNLGLLERYAGQWDVAERLIRSALQRFAQYGDERQVAIAEGNLGELLLRTGRLDEARGWLQGAVEHHRRASVAAVEGEFLSALAEVHLAVGERETAREQLDRAERLVRTSREPRALSIVLARRGLVEHAEGRDARETLAEARSLAPGARPTSAAGDAIERLAATFTS
jgi:tetratricopeptide (TPR) repeat protein